MIKYIFLDVDGVLTDGAIIYGEHCGEIKNFNVRDGLGIKLAIRLGYEIFVLTGRNSNVTKQRCKELGITNVFQGLDNKVKIYEEIKRKYNFSDNEAAYIGDDINDISLLKKVGFSATVNDAPDYVKDVVDFIVPVDGGKGAVRVFIEEIIKRNGQWEKVLSFY
ncbi:HAD-IIIA family hydrolase [Deferribacter autotrophicus]|uniref:3-deoxy-D-manno-octulosonate 8-phosphate phosphatase KdsC n=1 Tax=Deferribacter autotrophicus TaxID=500465 RepID=A0A5A8F400_9BACT|nr:HAD-IIIA family hydrolase [Deferribacter autotrophicus]KAA0258191.1 HAD-IIIA family hydrolase [Deferribacter autotrophicus]